jgi:hypothetical protein
MLLFSPLCGALALLTLWGASELHWRPTSAPARRDARAGRALMVHAAQAARQSDADPHQIAAPLAQAIASLEAGDHAMNEVGRVQRRFRRASYLVGVLWISQYVYVAVYRQRVLTLPYQGHVPQRRRHSVMWVVWPVSP